jgi:hypothetical protein
VSNKAQDYILWIPTDFTDDILLRVEIWQDATENKLSGA